MRTAIFLGTTLIANATSKGCMAEISTTLGVILFIMMGMDIAYFIKDMSKD